MKKVKIKHVHMAFFNDENVSFEIKISTTKQHQLFDNINYLTILVDYSLS